MKVIIQKDDNNQFSVGIDSDDAPSAMNPSAPPDPNAQPMSPDNDESNMQPAKDLQGALLMAAKLLSAPTPEGQSPFDQGVQKSLGTPLGGQPS